MPEVFIQTPPHLGNQYTEDVFLQSCLRRLLPATVLHDIEPELHEMGRLAGEDLYELQLADRLNEPRLTQWNAWGNRIDHIELTRLWQHAARIACEYGLVAIPYEREHGHYSRLHQFALLYLFHPSSDMYTCPLAMSDGAARTLLQAGNEPLAKRAVHKLISRDVNHAWTSGQWMTEASGGSDVGGARAEAIQQADGSWRLYGKKWFTSAIASPMALTLARPKGNGSGGSNLALFYVETRTGSGASNDLSVARLKDKLGTRKLPTAELLLDGAHAELVGASNNGTRAIEPMLVVTRVWNSIGAAAFMRRGMALAQSYAQERQAFGKRLNELPLHAATLAELEAETRAALLLTFELVLLLGAAEQGVIDEPQRALLRLLTPIAKLTTAKQAVAVSSEVLECFGGAGYVEDTGIAMLLRDAQVLPIWEGTTNVLALDALLRSDAKTGLAALMARVRTGKETLRDVRLVDCSNKAAAALERAQQWLSHTSDKSELQAGARRFALTLGRAFELALLCEQAQWQLQQGADIGSSDAVLHFANSQIAFL